MKSFLPFYKFVLLIGVVVILTIASYQIAVPQIGGSGDFPETGHTITGQFLDFYQMISNPELVYGYPITEQITTVDGLVVQYFQKARFELHPELPEEKQVQLTPLGNLMYTPEPSFPITKDPAICRLFETGFDVCYSFLEFFNQYGGIAQFGLPISDIEEREGRLVQYFEYVRMEWHPDAVQVGLSQEVQLTFLGRQYFDKLGEDPSLLLPVEGSFGQAITEIQVHGFLSTPFLSSGNQTLFVIVRDQNWNPIANVNVVGTVSYPNGTTASIMLGPTNKYGLTQIEFIVNSKEKGWLTIEVSAFNAAFEDSYSTSFWISNN